MENHDSLHKAIASRNIQDVRKFINEHPTVYDDKYIANQLLENRWLLSVVLKLANLNITKCYLESDRYLKENCVGKVHNRTIRSLCSCYDRRRALHNAASNNDIEHVKLLLDHDANPNLIYPIALSNRPSEDDERWNSTRLEIIKILYDRGVDNKNNLNAIQSILIHGDVQMIERVFNMDIDPPRMRDEKFNTALHHLVCNKDPKALTTIRGRDFDIDARNNYDQTPLWTAAYNGVKHAVEFLLNEGADVNAADYENITPIYIATQRSCINGEQRMECSRILLEHGADVQHVTSFDDDEFPTIIDMVLHFKDDDRYKIMLNLLLEHLALEEANGTSITELYQSKIDSDSEIKSRLDVCKQILARKVCESETLHEFLSCKDDKLERYMSNEESARVIREFNTKLESDSDYYSDLLKKRLAKATS